MKKYIRNIQPICAAVLMAGMLLLSSCHKDEGNYNYTELGDMYVNTSASPAAFIVKQFDSLKLKSNLVYSGDKSKLKYAWSIYLVESTLAGNPADTLSTQEDFAEPIPLFPEDYYLEFSATDPETGRRTSARYAIKVESLGSGLLVLYEKDGHVDCDLIKTKLLEGLLPEDNVLRNLYTLANPGTPLTGEALAIGSFSIPGKQYISVYTSNNGVVVSPADFSINRRFNDLFFIPPSTAKPQGYFAPLAFLSNNYDVSAGFEILVNDGQLYFSFVSLAGASDPTYSQMSGLTGAYKAVGNPVYGLARMVVYDDLSKGFITGGPLGSFVSPYVNTEQNALFNFSNIGKDLLYLNYGFGGTYMLYGIFKNTVDDGSRYMYIMDFASSTAKAKIDISGNTNISQATVFASGVRGQLMYYAAGNKIYQIPFDLSGGTAEQSIDAWPFIPANEEITCMKMFPHPGKNVSENALDKYLMVGTYDQNTGIGKVYFLQVNISSGTIQQTPAAVFTEFGKVKDISFKF